MAVERCKTCDNIVALAKELCVPRALLYRWRDQLAGVDVDGKALPEDSRESPLREEISQLKRLLAEKTMEVDFFRNTLQKVEARRQKSGSNGEKASTKKSET